MISVIDSHCHLDYEGLVERLGAVLANAEQAGVSLMLSVSTRVKKFPQLLQIAQANAHVFCSVGTHPHHAHEEQDIGISELIRLAQPPEVIGIGETGLDYHYDYCPQSIQKEIFRNHIAAARQTGLPLIVHCRKAEEDMMAILEEEMKKGVFKVLLHCFSSDAKMATFALEMGAYISFSGILTYNSAQNIRDIASTAPLSRILVETDAPYLAPVPYRGKINEPRFVHATLEKLAQIKNISPIDLAKATSDNFFALFTKAARFT